LDLLPKISSGERNMRAMHGSQRPRAKRKAVQIDLEQLEKLCALQCTDAEIAAWFHVSTRTLENRRQQHQFAEAIERGRTKKRISVRRHQMKLLEAGNSTMAVWLGKQLLSQQDVITAEHVDTDNGPIQVAVNPDLKRLND